MRALPWLVFLSLGLPAHAEVDACHDARRQALYLVECTSYDSAGTSCTQRRFDLRDGGVTWLPEESPPPDGGLELPAVPQPDELPSLPLDAGCVALRRVNLEKQLAVEVLDKGPAPDLDRADPDELYPLRWPRREIALKAGSRRLGHYTLAGINHDGVQVEGFDAGDHRHLLIVVFWKANGNEGSTDTREVSAVVALDASGLRTAPGPEGIFSASVRFDPELLDDVQWREVTAAALKKRKSPNAARWAGSAKQARDRLQLRRRPDFIAADEALRLLDRTPGTVASESPGVLRTVLVVYRFLDRLPAPQRAAAAEQLRHPIAIRAAADPAHWPISVGDHQSEELTRTDAGFLHSDGRPVDLGD